MVLVVSDEGIKVICPGDRTHGARYDAAVLLADVDPEWYKRCVLTRLKPGAPVFGGIDG